MAPARMASRMACSTCGASATDPTGRPRLGEPLAPEGPGMWVGRTWSMGDPLRGERPGRAGRSQDPDGEDGLELGGKHTPKETRGMLHGARGMGSGVRRMVLL